ncbi:MAG: glutamate synthase subunit beta [Firmicutes bacterium ADurb.Bin456]|nr:MAG: glutamate synthase subunit beta [Firmicutes bacterium ADurb.Bin456]
MRVAIVGAGPAGLACALELERRGIIPDIFERSNRVGHPIPRVEILLQLFGRPLKNQLRFLSEHYALELKPLTPLHKVVMHTFRRAVTVRGNLGYLVERGQSEQSIEVQLSRKLRSGIKFDLEVDYRTLASEYSFVVVAEGNELAASELGLWETKLNAWLKGAIVLGRFAPDSATIYFNTGYAGHGFGCLKPFNRDRALLKLIIPGVDRSRTIEHWKNFISLEKINLEVIETFEMNYSTGLTTRRQVDNILLVGASGGFTDSFLGLGLIASLSSGVLAGRAIAEGWDYEKLTTPLSKQARSLTAVRKAFNTLDNKDIDRLVRGITLPGIKQVIYNTNLNIIGMLCSLLNKPG